jgi:hypothetical protein
MVQLDYRNSQKQLRTMPRRRARFPVPYGKRFGARFAIDLKVGGCAAATLKGGRAGSGTRQEMPKKRRAMGPPFHTTKLPNSTDDYTCLARMRGY